MKDKEIIALAEKYGVVTECVTRNIRLLAFAKAIADMQKEKDAQICENLDAYEIEIRQDCANAIRSPETDIDQATRLNG